MYHGTIIQIDDCLVSEEILTEYFACDYEKCKGCCCLIGDSGAPMEECEAEAIEKNYHIFSPLMSDEGRAAVAAKGFYEIDMDGDMVTPLVPNSEECAYTLGTVNFMGADGHKVCTELFHVERDFAEGLNSVDVEKSR